MKEFGENRYSQPERRPVQADNLLDKSPLDFKSFFSRDTRHVAEAIIRLASAENPAPADRAAEEETPLQVFGMIIGTERRKQGLELEALSARAGMEPRQIAAIELGLASFEEVVAALPRLGDAFGGKYQELSARFASLALR